jgi:flagellar basal-body rod modification protein FlgD
MNAKLLFASVIALTLSQMPALACPEGNLRSTDYIRRGNRCEGIKRQPVSGNSLRLISIATRNIPSYQAQVSMKIPGINGGGKPEVKVQSLDKNYQLDNPSLTENSGFYTLLWDSYVLKREEVPSNSLRALASVNFGSQVVYVPVILGQSSGQYEFVFYSPSRVKFPIFRILRNGKEVYSNPRKIAQTNEMIFTWDSRNAPAGRYELQYEAEIEARGKPPEKINRKIVFEHNPKWLN